MCLSFGAGLFGGLAVVVRCVDLVGACFWQADDSLFFSLSSSFSRASCLWVFSWIGLDFWVLRRSTTQRSALNCGERGRERGWGHP